MNHTVKAAVLSACAFLLSASPAFASPGGPAGGGWEPAARLIQLVKKANLTSQQEAQISAIRADTKQQDQQLRSQWLALHEQLADKVLGTSTPTLADFSSLMQQMETVHSQQIKLGLQTALQIRAVLTPAQVTHITQIHQQLSNLNAQRRAVLQDEDAIEAPQVAPTPVLEGR
jgi:Spy/CpxP family protein refolding chaperone